MNKSNISVIISCHELPWNLNENFMKSRKTGNNGQQGFKQGGKRRSISGPTELLSGLLCYGHQHIEEMDLAVVDSGLPRNGRLDETDS